MSIPLKEKYIQTTAVKYLAEQYYRGCSHNGVIEYKLEATTKENKRADGIIVWEKSPKKVRLVSIEAKSATTIHNLKSRWNTKKLSKTSLLVAEVMVFLLFIPLFSLFKIQLTLDGAVLFVLLVLIYYFTFPVRKFLEKSFAQFFQTASIFEQVALYPGNEVWIAIGYDTFKTKRAERLQAFVAQCKKRQLGVIEIPADDQLPTILLRPSFKPAFKTKDFLAYYKIEGKLRKVISRVSQPASIFGTTRSKAETKYYLKNFSRASLLVSSLFIVNIPFKTLSDPPKIVSNYSSTLVEEKAKNYKRRHSLSKELSNQQSYKESPIIREIAPLIESPKEVNLATLCSDFPFENRKFVVQDQIVYSLQEAEERVELLKTLNFKDANYLYIPCADLLNKEEAFLVYSYNPRSHREKASTNLERYQYIMRTHNFEYGQAKILLVGKE